MSACAVIIILLTGCLGAIMGAVVADCWYSEKDGKNG